uniref:2-(3-amino-3-carboxypropyl)histidine synthase n=1 Tax=Thermosphaera aggregans TaxID=54254 RepID=A0A7C2BKF2_9CREN
MLKRFLDEEKPRKILLHAPDGLKPLYFCIRKTIPSSTEAYYSSSPGYGACDIPLWEAELLGADAIVHIGHLEYPFTGLRGIGKRVLYLPVYFNKLLDEEFLENLSKHLEAKGFSTISVSSTIVEAKIRGQIGEYLSRKGFKVYEVKQPVLGCIYTPVTVFDERVDAHLLIAGGLFHHLGAYLSLRKPLLSIDPYRQSIMDYSRELAKYLQKRLYLVSKVKNSTMRTLGIITGGMPGQYRPRLAEALKELAGRKGYEAYVISSTYLTMDRLIAIDNSLKLDFYVVTSCPRLPIDDLSDFYKPVLTPGEFAMILENKEEYVFPW